MPRKKVKGAKKRISAKQPEILEPEVFDESTLKLRSWLEDVCRNIDNFDVSEVPEIDENEIDLDENECNLKELEVSGCAADERLL
jgi:hypothetical protein